MCLVGGIIVVFEINTTAYMRVLDLRHISVMHINLEHHLICLEFLRLMSHLQIITGMVGNTLSPSFGQTKFSKLNVAFKMFNCCFAREFCSCLSSVLFQ